MGKGNKPTAPAPSAQYQTALHEVQHVSPQEELLTREALKTLEGAAKGDYRDPRSLGLFVNMGDPAMLHRNRELQANAGGQGIYGMGVADPNYLATVKANQAAENEQSDAAEYERNIREGVANAAGVAGSTAGMDLSRKMGILGTTSGVYQQDRQIKASTPKWWQYILQGASAGATALGA